MKKIGRKKSKKTNAIIFILFFIFMIWSIKVKEENKANISDDTQVLSNNIGEEREVSEGKSEKEEEVVDKWTDVYNEITNADMFKVGEILYLNENGQYVPAMKILDIQRDIIIGDGYNSSKAMKVQSCENEEDIFWKDINLTLESSSKEFGIKYYTKGKKYNS